MAWCPKCRTEYVDGIRVCADCGAELVSELPEEIEDLYVDEGMEETVEEDVNASSEGLELEESTGLLPDEYEGDMDERMLTELEEEQASMMLSDLRTESSSVYVKKKDKYADFKFSGISFIVFGIIGLGVVVLNLLEIISLFNTFSMGIMGVVFVIFLAIGISSLMRAYKIKDIVSEEERVTKEVEEWIKENITDEWIGSMTDAEQTEEENYFAVHSQLCKKLLEQFPFFSADYADQLMDERYNEYCDSHGEEG